MRANCQRSAHNSLPPVRVQKFPLRDGDAGIAQTIQLMRSAARRGAADPQVRETAINIVRSVPSRDSQGEINSVYQWVKQNIRFTGEYEETVQAPEVTLRFGAGDCDCQSVLVASLLGSIGYKVDFKTVAVHGERDFTHVYACVQDPSGAWLMLDPRRSNLIALDTTVPQASPGWQPPDISRERVWQGLGRMASAQDIASAINAASPVVNAVADVNVADFYRNGSAATGALNFNTYPGGFGVSGYSASTIPSWVWIAAFIGIPLAGIAISRGRRR